MMEEKKKLSCCCSASSIEKRCLKVDSEEGVQLLVSLRKNQDSDNFDQESTDGKTELRDAFSPIAGRIWAHQNRVYVKVPFSTTDLIHWKESARL